MEKKIKEKDKDKLKEVKTYGSKFVDCVCEDCRKKIEPYFQKNLVKIMIRPKKYQKKMAGMLCEKCRKNLIKKAYNKSG